ncbi:MAG: phage antirepressor KilAC domain-containing protein [Bacteroidaceae bacterium]|nr:phage antirepressor KilAC domain-containing protein [Bacteroidaceae bacterium]
MNELQVFKHELFGEIRTMMNEKCEVFFVGKDVALALGYSNTSKAIQQHVDKEDRSTLPIRESAYETRVTIINESGLYSLILSSKLPQAKAFKRWVTNEVLPQIAHTGGYIPTRNMRTGEKLTDGEVMEVANRIMQRTISRHNLPADDCVTTSEIAKTLGMTTKDLNLHLVAIGVQFWNGSRYKLKGDYEQLGYACERLFHYYALDGEKKERTYMVWTPTGVEFIHKLFNN